MTDIDTTPEDEQPEAAPDPAPDATTQGAVVTPAPTPGSNAAVWADAGTTAKPAVEASATKRHDFETAINTALGVTPATNASTWADAVASLKPAAVAPQQPAAT